jgi:hypothetical protein
MILTAHQPTYLPWLGTFHKILLSDTFCFFDIAQYQKKEWDNRNKIYTNNGPVWLSVPVESSNHFSKTVGTISIQNETSWAQKQYKTIYLNYKNHPFFEMHKPFLDKMFLHTTWEKLVDLNVFFYTYILKLLNKEIPIVMASDYDFQGEKSDLVLDMCKKLGASTYIFGGEGKNYADKASFEEANIQLVFQEYIHPIYKQYRNKNEFVSHLSILDLIMNYDANDLENIIFDHNIKRVSE